MSAVLLQAQGLRAAYGASQVLFGIDFEIRAGEVMGLLGRNGMGKTTLIRSLLGIKSPQAGSVRFEGTEITGHSSDKIARMGLAVVPEGRQVFPNLSVTENLIATARPATKASRGWTVDRVFGFFPSLAARRRNFGNQLSGGEQQMLAISRALMTNPTLLILDEATEGLSPLIRAEIWKALDTLRAEGMSILVIDKNIGPLLRLCDWHTIVEKGHRVWEGDSSGLAADQALHRRYLGA